ncbi:hypothetical protein GCM10011391_04310 [Pullulanibacillus camelliae]|uniref:Spore coat protein GerQ n=1 Tax=Pullulanibacillus camelliae TaxID=1707096 RepID=A0A8J2VK63_9BACL|nr:spore coat protein GerQ [Pullulanibacillus camelliae]GGE28884.1 hypothetical protein GCM10011391_04310 [Pullulanibacillus camelliae]
MSYSQYPQQGWQQQQGAGAAGGFQHDAQHPAYPYTGGAPMMPPQAQQTPPTHAVSPAQAAYTPGAMGFQEQSYIENILRMNLEKVATVYMTFDHEGGSESKAFRGEVEAAGRDHVIINDNKTGTRYLLPLVYLDYVTFQGPINYSYPYE